MLSHVLIFQTPFIPRVHIPSIIKHLVYYTTLGIVKINIFEHFKKYLNSTNIFLETDNNCTHSLIVQHAIFQMILMPSEAEAHLNTSIMMSMLI